MAKRLQNKANPLKERIVSDEVYQTMLDTRHARAWRVVESFIETPDPTQVISVEKLQNLPVIILEQAKKTPTKQANPKLKQAKK
jgi:hypothetical protein